MDIMTRLLPCLFIGITALAPTVRAADEMTVLLRSSTQWLVLIAPNKNIKVTVTDSVTDGCWLDPSAARMAVELEFTRSGFRVVPDSTNEVALVGFGSLIGPNICVVVYSLTLYVADFTTIYDGAAGIFGMAGEKSLFRSTAFVSGSRTFVNGALVDSFIGQSRRMLLEIETKLGVIEDDIEAIQEPVTRERWVNWFRRHR